MEALGSDAVEIPNGVDVASLHRRPCSRGIRGPPRRCCSWPLRRAPQGDGRADDALPSLVERFPGLQVLIVGRGNEEELRAKVGGLAGHLRFLGLVDDTAKASALRSADVYCAPHLGGESFGIVLVEAMAAGTPVVASNLHAFRRVLRDGQAGGWWRSMTALRWPRPDRGAGERPAAKRYAAAGEEAVRRYDWPVVANQIMRVYRRSPSPGTKCRWRADVMDAFAYRCLGPPAAAGAARIRRLGVRSAIGWTRLHVRYDLSGRPSMRRWPAGPWCSRSRGRRVRCLRLMLRSGSWSRGPTRRKPRHGGPVKRVRTSCRPRWRWLIRLRCLRA